MGLGLNMKKNSNYGKLQKSWLTNLQYKFEQPPSGTNEELQMFGNVYLLWWEISAWNQNQNWTSEKKFRELIKDADQQMCIT